MLQVKETQEASPNAPPVGYPAATGSAGDDRRLGCASRARGPLPASDASALAAETLTKDAVGTRCGLCCRHAPPRVPGCPSFCDDLVAALARPARLARGSGAVASPCSGAQGTLA